VPVDIKSFLQAPEDYALNYIPSSLFRILRHLSAFAALILPAAYVSMTTFHHEMLPSDLVVSIVASKQGSRFPTFVEVLLCSLPSRCCWRPACACRGPSASGVDPSAPSSSARRPSRQNPLSERCDRHSLRPASRAFVVPSQDLANTIRFCRFLLVFCSVVSGLFGVSSAHRFLAAYHCARSRYSTRDICRRLSPTRGNRC
jgi:spore germination protein KA